MKKKTKSICEFGDCLKPKMVVGSNKAHSLSRDRFCLFHFRNATIARHLHRVYCRMKDRVVGYGHNRGNWVGKPILPKEIFVEWGTNHPTYLKLYKRWVMSGFDRKLAPSVNRIDSNKGYTLDNIEWMTNSQNCSLAGSVKSYRSKKMIYDILGVKNV